MSAALRRGRWQGGGAADSTDVRQGATNAASGILIELLSSSTCNNVVPTHKNRERTSFALRPLKLMRSRLAQYALRVRAGKMLTKYRAPYIYALILTLLHCQIY